MYRATEPELSRIETLCLQHIKKPYFPSGGRKPIHRVYHWKKVYSMIVALNKGYSLPCVYYYKKRWLGGMHRLSASELRAKIYGLEPYKDLRIFNAGLWIDRLPADLRKAWWKWFNWDMTEEMTTLLDLSTDYDSFKNNLIIQLKIKTDG